MLQQGDNTKANSVFFMIEVTQELCKGCLPVEKETAELKPEILVVTEPGLDLLKRFGWLYWRLDSGLTAIMSSVVIDLHLLTKRLNNNGMNFVDI